MSEEALPLQVLNREIMIDLVGDDHDYIQKCELNFIKQAQTNYNEIVAAFKQNDFTEIKDKAHFLKTSASAIGAEQLAHSLQELEHLAAGEHSSSCKKLIVDISKSIKLVYEEIKV